MIIEGLMVAAVVAKTFYSVDKSIKMDNKALDKYARAFEKSEEAKLLVHQKADFMDKRLANVAKKKRAIIQNTVPRFMDVYGQIQKIESENKTPLDEISLQINKEKLGTLNSISLSVKKEFTDKELVCGFMVKGIGKLMEIDSERYLSAANNQMSQANVIYSQAESIVEIYDAIIKRADRISNLLMTLNALFIKSIGETEKVIGKNGLDVQKYSDFDKGVLLTCVNIAYAMSDVIDVPVVDENGDLCEKALQMIEAGEQEIIKIKEKL